MRLRGGRRRRHSRAPVGACPAHARPGAHLQPSVRRVHPGHCNAVTGIGAPVRMQRDRGVERAGGQNQRRGPTAAQALGARHHHAALATVVLAPGGHQLAVRQRGQADLAHPPGADLGQGLHLPGAAIVPAMIALLGVVPHQVQRTSGVTQGHRCVVESKIGAARGGHGGRRLPCHRCCRTQRVHVPVAAAGQHFRGRCAITRPQLHAPQGLGVHAAQGRAHPRRGHTDAPGVQLRAAQRPLNRPAQAIPLPLPLRRHEMLNRLAAIGQRQLGEQGQGLRRQRPAGVDAPTDSCTRR